MIEWFLNLQITSPNAGGHWAQRYARDNHNKKVLAAAFMLAEEKPIAPCRITLTRQFTKQNNTMDFDNLVSAFKGTRDAIAALLIPGLAAGRADDEERGLRWEYFQEKGREAGVRVQFKEIVNE
jgi:hypothetical protein